MLKFLLLLAIVLACACPLCCCGPARADESPRVSEGQICEVRREIRWRGAAWSQAKCRKISEALNATRSPLLTEAVCINESDLREYVVREVRPGVYDVGLCGIRCVVTTAEGAGPPLDRECQNGSARGYKLRQLLDGATSIRLSDEILHVTHGGSLRRYNGGTREHGYARRVGAILAALGGVDVFAKRRRELAGRRETRVEKLVRQILEAVARVRQP